MKQPVIEPELRPEGAAVDAALAAWRRKAADVVLIVAAAAHFPSFVLMVVGTGPPMGLLVRALGITAYLGVAAVALMRWVDQRKRLWVFFFAGYVAVAVTNLAIPDGPYAQVALVTLPILVLVLRGDSAANIAILVSAIVLVAAPFLRVLPGVARALAIDPTRASGPPGLVWGRATAMAAFLCALMVLLDRFHRFLLDALTERIAAQRKVEWQMREQRRLEREIAGIGDEERRRLGQELHDGVCQQITAALLRCQALQRHLERSGTLSVADFAPLSSLLAESIDEAHNVARGLFPLEPEPDALAPALRALSKRTQEIAGVRCEFTEFGAVRVPDPEAIQHLYRIAQEALSNAVRHANAGRIAIELCARDGELILQVEDDGAGLPVDLPGSGMGLRTMAYRARILRGELTLGPTPGGGTRVVCRVPIAASALAGGHPA